MRLIRNQSKLMAIEIDVRDHTKEESTSNWFV